MKASNKEVIWLGPYKPSDRHADDITLDHYVKLVRKVQLYEDALSKIYWETDSPFVSNIARRALDEGHDIAP